MTTIIKVQGKADPAAPKIIRTPGVSGYTARFIASHLPAPDGAQLTEWPSVPGTPAYPLKIANSYAASTSKLAMGQENGIPHVVSPGGNTQENGGRLLGAHIPGARPITLAGVFKAGKGVESYAGIGGFSLSRNTSANGYYISNGSAYTLVQRDGWVFVMIAAAADTSFVLRADDYEAAKPAPGPGVPPNYGGLYFGANEPGDTAAVRELVFWPRQLDRAERDAVHAYFRTQYPDIL